MSRTDISKLNELRAKTDLELAHLIRNRLERGLALAQEAAGNESRAGRGPMVASGNHAAPPRPRRGLAQGRGQRARRARLREDALVLRPPAVRRPTSSPGPLDRPRVVSGT